MRPDEQLKTDLIVLHGYVYDREGFDPAFSIALAKALKLIFPRATLPQLVEKQLDSLTTKS